MNKDTTKAIAGLLGVANLYSIAYIFETKAYRPLPIAFMLITGVIAWVLWNKSYNEGKA